MKKQYYQETSKLFVAIIIFIFFSAIGLRIWQRHFPDDYLILKGQNLHVWVADTGFRMHKGMSGKKEWDEFQGMLFVFGYLDKHAIVMRDMDLPLDIVWLNNGKVVDIAPEVQPEDLPEEQLTKYYPRQVANFVLEMPSGWAKEHGLVIGDIIEAN